MEYLDLLDQEGNLVGKTCRRGEFPSGSGLYYRVAFLWVGNGTGKFLLTRRAPEKKRYPGQWETPGGAVQAGESSLQAAVRELWEETGLIAQASELRLLQSIREADYFCDTYYVRCRQEAPIVLQPGETVESRWADLLEIRQLIAEGVFTKPDTDRYYQLYTVLAECNSAPA